jgi:hypothetical protein
VGDEVPLLPGAGDALAAPLRRRRLLADNRLLPARNGPLIFFQQGRAAAEQRSTMPTVAPTHSIQPNAQRVYHNNSRCAELNNIQAGDRRQGTGGRPVCLHCSSLKSQGK